jgi:DNA-binding transcriptional ArsR family regulator
MVQSATLDAVYGALAEPHRRSMVRQLSQRGPQSVSQLKAALPISLPAVMQHLNVLTRSGLVRTHKRGGARICELRPVALDQAQRWIGQRREAVDKRLDRLGQYLESGQEEDS